MIKKTTLVCSLLLTIAGCASLVTPTRQRVKINSDSDSSRFYVEYDYVEYNMGNSGRMDSNIAKWGTLQVRIQTPDCKDNYTVLLPYKRRTYFFLMQPLNLLNVGFGSILDFYLPKNIYYPDSLQISLDRTRMTYRNRETEKGIIPGFCATSFSDIDLDNLLITVRYTVDSSELKKRMKESEERVIKDILDLRIENQKKETRKKLSDESATLTQGMIQNFEKEDFNQKIMRSLSSLMLETAYSDTSQGISSNVNNTIVLDPVIRKIKTYKMQGVGEYCFYEVHLRVDWQVRSTYGTLIETISQDCQSGGFLHPIPTALIDALENGYLALFEDKQFQEIIKLQIEATVDEPLLELNAPVSPITYKGEVARASLIVKTSLGHGSGFAITNDGYIITNYHVVAGKDSVVDNLIEVIDGIGNRYPATVVRFNRLRDLALLKIEDTIQKAFVLQNDSLYTLKLSVYTIGAPKSVELGQSLSQGYISGIRYFEEIDLIEMDMSVNSGNSGGPVFDGDGNLHGVVVSKIVGLDIERTSYAIPAHKIMEYLNISYK